MYVRVKHLKVSAVKNKYYIKKHCSDIKNTAARCFVFYLRTNSDFLQIWHKLIGFYKADEKCLQRGTNWVFKCSSLRFVLKC